MLMLVILASLRQKKAASSRTDRLVTEASNGCSSDLSGCSMCALTDRQFNKRETTVVLFSANAVVVLSHRA